MFRCNRIVVPLDGSEAAERALPIATDLARHLAVPLHVVRVADTVDMIDAVQPSTPEELAREIAATGTMAEEYLAAVRARLATADLEVTAQTFRGDAARRLLKATGCRDLIVMTRWGRGESPALGRVADWVAGRARGLVLLVPPADRGPVAAEPTGATRAAGAGGVTPTGSDP